MLHRNTRTNAYTNTCNAQDKKQNKHGVQTGRRFAPVEDRHEDPVTELAPVVVVLSFRQQSAARAERRHEVDLHVPAPAVEERDVHLDVLQIADPMIRTVTAVRAQRERRAATLDVPGTFVNTRCMHEHTSRKHSTHIHTYEP